mmetsp:Transcript_26479/g.61524  ORF Transcript_26479/g.61524 Transcript_26479/m.61524 type:complete len:335 (-) Transcript_26479:1145-2149(-)
MKALLQKLLLHFQHDVFVLLVHVFLHVLNFLRLLLLLHLRQVCEAVGRRSSLAVRKLPQRREVVPLFLPRQHLLLLLLKQRQLARHLGSRDLGIFAGRYLLYVIELRGNENSSCTPIRHAQLVFWTGVYQDVSFTFLLYAGGVQPNGVCNTNKVCVAFGTNQHILEGIQECVAGVPCRQWHLVELLAKSGLVVRKPMSADTVTGISFIADGDAKIADHRNGTGEHASLSQQAHFQCINAHKVGVWSRARQDRPPVLRAMEKACCMDVAAGGTYCISAHDIHLVIVVHIRGLHVRQDNGMACISCPRTAAVRRLKSLPLDQKHAAPKHGGVFEIQ